MGITYEMATLLLQAKRAGLDLSAPLCLGRMRMSVRPYELDTLLDRLLPDVEHRARADALASIWAEPFLRMLGAETVQTLDASAYEGADIVHSLNDPVPRDLWGRFSVVIDGGTLEHVFNTATALDAVMRVLRPGGIFVTCGPCNNQVGAGFYQFSPELYFRVFTPENGFRLLGLYLSAARQTQWWEVVDPAESGRRTVFRAPGETRLLCVARKEDPDGQLREGPTQSSYATAWDRAPASAGPEGTEESTSTRRRVSAAKRALHAVLPRGLVTGLRDWRSIRRARRRAVGDLRRIDPLTTAPLWS